MTIDINNCDFNNDYFHFTNRANIYNILNAGLRPLAGAASQLVGDEPNVSLSKGGKGIMGIINSFIYMFSKQMKISQIPEEYRKYFLEISDFISSDFIPKDIVCKAMIRKLQDEVYLRVDLEEEQLESANIGGLTGYDIKLPLAIDKSKIRVITNANNDVLSAYDVALHIYEKTKNIDIFRMMHEDFFFMFENLEAKLVMDCNSGYATKK